MISSRDKPRLAYEIRRFIMLATMQYDASRVNGSCLVESDRAGFIYGYLQRQWDMPCTMRQIAKRAELNTLEDCFNLTGIYP